MRNVRIQMATPTATMIVRAEGKDLRGRSAAESAASVPVGRPSVIYVTPL
jgi:hypothetical protein